jgi:hypothetical protein
MTDLKNNPCHTQVVKRDVNVVTDAARLVYNKEHRKCKLESGKNMSNYIKKSYWRS